jgi:dolichol kinase
MATWIQIPREGSNATFTNLTVYDTVTAGSFSGSFTGSFSGSFPENDPIFSEKSASLATTGSNVFRGIQTFTGSLDIDVMNKLPQILLISVLCALIELIPVGDDNITVPIVAGIATKAWL